MQRPCGGNKCGIFKELKKKQPVFLDFRGMEGRERERESRIRVDGTEKAGHSFL